MFTHFKSNSPYSFNIIFSCYLPEFSPQIAHMDFQGTFHAVRGRSKITVVGSIGNSQQSVILSGMGTANTQLASHDQTKILEVGAIRGRYNEEGRVEQHLELKDKPWCSYAITSVQKDNIILVRQDTVKGYEECMAEGVVNIAYPNAAAGRFFYAGRSVYFPTWQRQYFLHPSRQQKARRHAENTYPNRRQAKGMDVSSRMGRKNGRQFITLLSIIKALVTFMDTRKTV